jgi:carbon monoxide dehydrogenase subunit G
MVEIVGSYELEASIDEVWPHIFEPTSLMGLIPGCQQLEQVAPDEYRGQIQVAIAAVGGRYDSVVKVVERDAPHRCRFEGEVSGSAGRVRGSASFSLREVEGGNNSLIEYQAKGMITGALARLNPRYVEGIARTLINQGLVTLNQRLQDRPAANTADHFKE